MRLEGHLGYRMSSFGPYFPPASFTKAPSAHATTPARPGVFRVGRNPLAIDSRGYPSELELIPRDVEDFTVVYIFPMSTSGMLVGAGPISTEQGHFMAVSASSRAFFFFNISAAIAAMVKPRPPDCASESVICGRSPYSWGDLSTAGPWAKGRVYFLAVEFCPCVRLFMLIRRRPVCV